MEKPSNHKKVWGSGFRAGIAAASKPLSASRWAVLQRESGLLDGWYFDRQVAGEMLEFWSEEYPSRTHVLVAQIGVEWPIGEDDKRLNKFWLMDVATRPKPEVVRHG